MSYHPDQRFVTPLTLVHRRVLLPQDALGTVSVRDGQRVDPRDVVVQGVLPSRHVIVEGAEFFGLKKRENLASLLLVEIGDPVDTRQPIAGKSATRGKRLFSPVRGLLAAVTDGRIIIQEMPELVRLEAGVRGRVTEVIPGRGVVIETPGALIQGVWGNDRRTLATLRIEPDDGLENISADALEMQYVGAVVVTRRPLRAIGLAVMQDQGFSGIIAPSMDADLRDQALRMEAPLLLTEGFGSAQMSSAVFNLLTEFDRKQVVVDAVTPTRANTRRPEVIIPQVVEQRPAGANPLVTLRKGVEVRIIRPPHLGATGRIVDLPKTPYLIDNGLRVPCAQVELVTGGTVPVPLANLEYYGR